MARVPEVGWVRRGRPVNAACVAGLLLSGPAAQAVPAAQGVPAAQAVPAAQGVPAAQSAPASLPGPLPGCPPQHGVAAPAGAPWPQRTLRFSSVWDRTRGAGVTVAVVDSGVDANPQFGNRVIPGPDLAAAKPGVPAGADCVGHGTAMASIIAAAPVPGISFTGVAPAARILSVRISSSDTFATGVTPQAIRDAVALGASVINLSLATTDDVPALRSAVEFALRRDVVVVAAAGNDLEQSGVGPFYPAAYPGVLAVGAVGPGGALAGFSDQRTPVSVTAPGVNVTSAYPGTFPDAYDPVQNGTSFAAAYVSGVVALVRSAYPRLDAAQVVARIEATAHGAAGPGTGHGLVDPVRAVTAPLPPGQAAAGQAAAGQQSASGQSASGQSASKQSASKQSAGKQAAGKQAAGKASAGPGVLTVALAVAAGSFGLVIAVVLAVSAARRRRPPGAHRVRRSGPL